MNRYSFGEVATQQAEPHIDLAQEALDIIQDVEAAEACYEQLVEADRACDEVSAVLENLQTLSDTLKECFYSNESIETINIDKTLTRITGYATDSITPQIAEEAIGENLKKAWESLKAFISKIIDAIGGFFAKLFNMASAQAQKIIDTKGGEIDFAAEKETLTAEQYKNLKNACEALNDYCTKHIDISGVFKIDIKLKADSADGSTYMQNLNTDLGKIVAASNNTIKVEESKVTIVDAALHREKKTLSSAGWTAASAVEIATYFLANKDKATRLGTLMKRLKQLNVAGAIGAGGILAAAKTAMKAEASSYACYAKCLRAFGKQVKCLNGAVKKKESK